MIENELSTTFFVFLQATHLLVIGGGEWKPKAKLRSIVNGLLGFHWNDDVLLLEILNKEPNTIIGLNLNGYLVSRSIGRKIFMQDASVHLEPRNTANLKVGNYDFLSKHCFSKKELKDSSIKRVKAGFIFEILLRFAEKQEDEDTIE